jgi:hypothetical protein
MVRALIAAVRLARRNRRDLASRCAGVTFALEATDDEVAVVPA